MNDLSADPHSETIDMAITHREFYRLWEKLHPPDTWNVEGQTVRLGEVPPRVEVHLSDEYLPDFIPQIRLPRTILTFTFYGCEDDWREAFIKKFRLHFHRGGG